MKTVKLVPESICDLSKRNHRNGVLTHSGRALDVTTRVRKWFENGQSEIVDVDAEYTGPGIQSICTRIEYLVDGDKVVHTRHSLQSWNESHPEKQMAPTRKAGAI